MDFLNNIWVAISTPNEELLRIIVMPLIFVEIYMSLLIFSTILNIKSTTKQKLFYVFTASILSLTTLYLIPAPFNSFLNYILLFIIIHFTFKLTILKTIVALVMPTIIFGLIGTLVINPLVKIIGIDYNIAQTIPLYRVIYLLCSYTLSYILTLFIKHKNIYLRIVEELDKKTKFTLIITFILGFIVLAIQLAITVYYTNTLPLIISFLSFISLLAYFIINIYSLTKVTNLTLTKQQLHNAEEYNKTLQILHDNIRGFRHDYNNKIATLGGYIKDNDIEGLKNYYDELEKECIKTNQLHMLNPNIINNPGIYSLLTTKYNLADEYDIDFNIDVMLDLNTINMKMFDFTKILGILIDNAIDAAKECNKKTINISFRNDEKNNRQLLVIENTYLDKEVNIDKIFDKGVTSKKDHTGLGLWEIRKILKRNNNLNLHTTKDEKYFTQQFEIYK